MDGNRFTLRLIGLAVGLVIGFLTGDFLDSFSDSGDTRSKLLAMAVAIGGLGYMIGPQVIRSLFHNLRRTVTEASTVDLVAVGVGLAFGALIAAPLAVPLSFLPDPLGTFLPFVAAVAVCALTIYVALLRKRDLIHPWLRGRSPRPPAAAPTIPAPTTAPEPTALIDTSVIIDGRLVDLARTGFVDDRLLLPRFVLDELQRIADSDDPLRRARGRRGLDALARLQQELPRQVEVIDDPVPQEREVDAKLVRLAKQRGVRILTNDYNLNRVAQVQGVRVLNLNELAGALRPPVLPGEEIRLKVVQEGREAGQGVGFLDDGTMVVVDGGKPLVGKQTSVTVTRLLQTGTGRLVFATPKHAGS